MFSYTYLFVVPICLCRVPLYKLFVFISFFCVYKSFHNYLSLLSVYLAIIYLFCIQNSISLNTLIEQQKY